MEQNPPILQRTVHLGARSYQIIIGYNILFGLRRVIPSEIRPARCVIVSDSTVFGLYGEILSESLRSAGFTVAQPFIIQPGEESKCFESLRKCCLHLITQQIGRTDYIFTLGGGVPGDLGGFAAGIYMRGIRFIQIPTSLLAQVDASVGGKTAVNLGHKKNIVGVFHQPKLVCIDPETLKTLPVRHIGNGLAEALKMGILADASLFERLESILPDSLNDTPEKVTEIIARCCELKAAIVSADEFDQGRRMTLNLGHTVGHAIEAVFEQREILHGEAVALGILAAAKMAVATDLLPPSDFNRIKNLISKIGLPTTIPDLDREAVFRNLLWDKKVIQDKPRFILPETIGKVVIRDALPPEVIRLGISAITSS